MAGSPEGSAPHSDFFEHWSKLATADPERFERERRKAIEEIIARAPEEQSERLWRLQWRIDMERARASNPLSACIRLNRMMLDHFYGPNGLVDALNGLADSMRALAPPETKAPGEVLQLVPPQR
ncbi:MAG TPA: DUF3135 domain-containing protein [Candidatus Paceibacterota bacterium]|nr:DUF3135 domain-containing protein [Candidatus Paceibacterota bacterium]